MPRVTDLETVHVETMPAHEQMEYGKIYVSKKFELAIHLCACGECGIQTVTSFWNPVMPELGGWQYTEVDGKVTLHPSIGNMNFPCKSHYFVQGGKVTGWC